MRRWLTLALALACALAAASTPPSRASFNASAVNAFLQSGHLRVGDAAAGEEAIDQLLLKGILQFGSPKQTHGHVFHLNHSVPRACLKQRVAEPAPRVSKVLHSRGVFGRRLAAELLEPAQEPPHKYLAVCAIICNQAWVLNEWLVWHLWVVGVDHVVLYNDNSADNLQAVVQPWVEAGLVSVFAAVKEPHTQRISQWLSSRHCFQQVVQDYTWFVNIDVDEFLFPLRTPCVPELLPAYEAHASLSVGWAMATGSSRQVVARRDHTTVFEATRFSLGAPHALVKTLCAVGHTAEPSANMPHCCEPRDGYERMDEGFEVIPRSQPCWFRPEAKRFKPMELMQVFHFQGVSFEEVLHRRMTRHTAGGFNGDDTTKAGFPHFTQLLHEYETQAREAEGRDSLAPPDILARMHGFRGVLNSVLIGRRRIEQAFHHGGHEHNSTSVP